MTVPDAVDTVDDETLRSATERLVHAIFGLEVVPSIGPGRMVKLPDKGLEVLPRAKAIPVTREPTKWELFARAKGIPPKKKRERMVWDAEAKEFRPRFGYKRAGKNLDEVKEVTLPTAMNASRSIKKTKEKVRPVASVASGGVYQPKSGLERGLKVAQRSTASAGRFDKRVEKEPNIEISRTGKRRKFDSVADRKGMESERKRALSVMDRLLKGEPKPSGGKLRAPPKTGKNKRVKKGKR